MFDARMESLLAHARRLGADSGDVLWVKSESMAVARRLGRKEKQERSDSEGLGLRVFIGKKSAAASSADLSPKALEELAERVVLMAKLAPEDPHAGLLDSKWLAKDVPDLDLSDSESPSPIELARWCEEAEEAALAVKGVTNSEGAEAEWGRTAYALVTSTGFFGRYETSSGGLSMSVLAGSGQEMQRDYAFSQVRHRKDLEAPANVGREAAERTVAKLHARKMSSCKVPVVFDSRVSRSLLSAFTEGISGSMVARGTSFLLNQMGKSVFGPSVRIMDDPLRPKALGSRPFDAEGMRGSTLAMVEGGVLQSWLLDGRSARQLGMDPTGHAVRGLSSSTSPAPTNLYMEAGKESPEQLIAGIEQGFYVTELFGMGVNTTTGDYSQGAAGFWIEKGKKTYPVHEVTIAGHLLEMFAKLIPASDLEFRYRMNAPTLLIESMTVAGA